MTSPVRALTQFHLAAGARVALRANAIVGAMVVFMMGSAPEALNHLRLIVLGLVGPGDAWGARIQLAALCAVLAGVAAPRITLGASGWMRSLPAASSANRRATIVALSAAQAFAIVVMVGAILMTVLIYRRPLSPSRIVALPVMLASAAVAALPVRRATGQFLGVLALALSVPANWLLTAASVILLVAADRISGGIAPSRRGKRALAPALATPTRRRVRSPFVQWLRLSWRALPPLSVVGSALLPALFIAFAYFIVRHNPGLERSTATRTVRISGLLAVAALVAGFTNLILRARPAWSWARTLPWSSRQRVLVDTTNIGAVLLTVPIALLPLDALQALVVAATIPAIASSAAAALRAGSSRQTGAAGEAVTATVIAGALIAVWPNTWIFILGATPVVFRFAVRRERNAHVTRWTELRHDAAGDPAWFGGT